MPAIRRQDNLAIVGGGGPASSVVGILFLVFGLAMEAAMVIPMIYGETAPVKVNGQLVTDPSLGEKIWMVVFPAFFAVVGLLVFLSGKNSRFEIDDQSIRQYDMWGRKKEILWSDARSYEQAPPKYAWSRRPQLALVGSSEKIVFSTMRIGWPLVDGEILHHLPRFRTPVGTPASSVQRYAPSLPPEGLAFKNSGYIVAGVILLLMGLLFTVLPLMQPPNGDKVGAALFALVGLCILVGGVALLLNGINAKLVLTESSITQLGITGKPQDEIRWAEVEAFEFETIVSGKNSTTRYYILRSRDRYLRLSDQMSKWSELREAIVSLLPPDASVVL